MDITLERILSLMPKKPNGDFVHGAKKEFCEKIGAPTNIVNEWVRGVSKSYRNYLYQISAVYHVSVEWLKGETDIKNPASETETGKVPTIQDWKDLLATFNKEELKAIIDMATSELIERD